MNTNTQPAFVLLLFLLVAKFGDSGRVGSIFARLRHILGAFLPMEHNITTEKKEEQLIF